MTVVLAGAVLQADVKVQDKHQLKIGGALGKLINMFAGKSMREPTLGTTAIKGDRKLVIYGDYGQIVDLQEEKIYTLDMKNKTYKVRTFEEARKAAREAREKMQQQQAKQKPDTEKAEKKPDQQAPEYEIDVASKPTGQTKSINGFDTKQVITTVTVRQKGKTLEEGGGLLVTTDSWVAPRIDALKERAEFEKRYIAKMADDGPASSDVPPETMAAALSMYPMLADAMKRAHVEGEKVDGTPIMTTMNIDGVADPNAQQQDTTTSNDQPTTPSGLGGFLAKKMMKKNKDKEGEQGSGDAEALPKGHSRIMTIYQEVQSVTTDVAAADVALPEGLKEK
jgi:hypothetical protein